MSNFGSKSNYCFKTIKLIMKQLIEFIKNFFSTPEIKADYIFQVALHGEQYIELDENTRIRKCIKKAIDWSYKKSLCGECQCLAKIDQDLISKKDIIIDILQKDYHFIVKDLSVLNPKYSHLLLLDVDPSE